MNIFLTWYAKGVLDTFIFQASNKKLSCSLRLFFASLLSHTCRFFHQEPRFSTWVAGLASVIHPCGLSARSNESHISVGLVTLAVSIFSRGLSRLQDVRDSGPVSSASTLR